MVITTAVFLFEVCDPLQRYNPLSAPPVGAWPPGLSATVQSTNEGVQCYSQTSFRAVINHHLTQCSVITDTRFQQCRV